MKVLFCLAVLGYSAVATPSGYYHQEYNYKTSSSSWKNNELQHKTDDQGYYKKDGDLEGRSKPRIDANSEHSEYVNPNLKSSQYGYSGAAGTDMNSYGHMKALHDYGTHGSNTLTEGVATSDRLMGTAAGYSAGSQYGSSSYGSSSSYGVSSNLHTITSRLQQDLERELQSYVRDQTLSRSLDELEAEIRHRVNDRLQNELLNRYGQQTVRGGLSYSISGGRTQNVANYDNRELEDWKIQVENQLLNQLRQEYSQRYGGSASYSYQGGSSSHSQQGYNTYPTSTVRPYQTIYPSLPTHTTPRPAQYDDYAHSQYKTVHTNVRYTPIPNPESITNIATRIQNQLDRQLNDMLDQARQRYFSSSANYALTNTDRVLERMKEELKGNLTVLLDEDIRRNYGQQIERDGQYYSMGPNGQISPQHNYAVNDLENLKYQIERNLFDKLNRDFETYRSRWSSQQSHSSQSAYGSNYLDHSSGQYGVYTTPRNNYYQPTASRISSLVAGGSNNNYNYNSNYGIKGHGTTQYSSSSNMAELQRRLQDDLSRQLQAAITKGHYDSYSYSPSNYQTSLQQLQDELHRNLTRQLSEYSASGSYAAHGDFDESQMAALKSQLESSLMNQLQQGLQRSFATHSSYSASSSSSASGSASGSYRPVRGSQYYQAGMGQQYRAGYESMDDCVGDDPNAYSRQKRSYQPYRSRPIGLGVSANSNYGGYGAYGSVGRHQPVGQQVDDSDSTQQVEESGFGVGQQTDDSDTLEIARPQHLGQEVDDSDTQQIEDTGFGKLSSHGQLVDNSQAQESGFGKLQSQSQVQAQLGQQVDDSDTQQVEELGFGKPLRQGQLLDHSETQQVQNPGFGKLQSESHTGQQVDDSDTQQVEESGFDKPLRQGQLLDNTDSQLVQKPLYSGMQSQSQRGQQVDDTDTQQIEESGFGKPLRQGQLVDQSISQPVQKPEFGRLQSQSHLGQQVDDSDTQQVEEAGFQRRSDQPLGRLQSQSQVQAHLGQQVDDSDTQQIEESGFGRQDRRGQYQTVQEPGVGTSLGQQVDDSDTQQVEDSGFGKLEAGNQVRGTTRRPGVTVNLDAGRRYQTDELDAVQQVQEPGFGRVPPNQYHVGGQVEDNSDLNQHVEKDLNSGSQTSSPSNPKDLDVIVNELERDISSQLQGEVSTKPISPRNPQEIQDLIKRLENSLNLKLQDIRSNSNQYGSSHSMSFSGNLNEQQLQYLKEEVQNHIQKELEKKYGQGFRVTSFWSNSQSQSVSDTGLMQNTHRGFNNINFNDFTKEQVQTCQEVEDKLLEQLKEAIRLNINVAQSSSDDQIRELRTQLHKNITKEIESFRQGSHGYLYTLPQINRIQLQLESDLNKEFQQEIDTQNPLNVGSLRRKEAVEEKREASTHKKQEILSWNMEGFSTKQAQFCQYLEDTITKKLKDSVKTNYINYQGLNKPAPETVYKELLIELPQSIDKRLSSFSQYFLGKYMSFNQERLAKIKEQLNHNLKIKLQRELSIEEKDSEVFEPSSAPSQFSGRDIEPIEQHPEVDSDAIQKMEGNPFGSTQTLQVTTPDTLVQQTEEIEPLNSQSVTPQEPLARVPMFTNSRPVVPRPVSSNQFLQTEIDLQQREIQNQRAFGGVDQNQRYPGNIGQQHVVTGQGEFVVQPQTREEAEQNADQLIDSLRAAQNNRQNPSGDQDRQRQYYNGGTHRSYGSHNYRSSYGSHHTHLNPSGDVYQNEVREPLPTISSQTGQGSYGNQLSYGHQQEVNHQFETASNIEPVYPARVNEVQTVDETYRPQTGVKGGIRGGYGVYQSPYSSTQYTNLYNEPTQDPQLTASVNADVEEVAPVNLNAEELSWWQRFSKKVKQGAKNLKEKIVG
ncbi:unnamed protein product [Acanthoscelides obtectus]|uniref:Uncharacterized protein n=1 Tax=Acanthoscelides obtectus TaxID=200917 RepID=A0A9P0KR89_ACAOB|nr:unnamed protein product [Acanthoscelides obtectus]CAK1647343.1 hypothetical protein AOBTE_LOCUS15191 [Acanthoscelides obtectus]